MTNKPGRYGADEISSFLRAVDRNLGRPSQVVIIGGSAAAFHNASSTTTDVDTYEALDSELVNAIERARKETGVTIPISHSSVADVPYNYEDRLVRVLPDLQNLRVFVLEKHDLALSKTVRGTAHDEQQIEEIHRCVGLDFDTLVTRFRDEMRYVVGDPQRIRSQFLQLIEVLYDEVARVKAERLLK